MDPVNPTSAPSSSDPEVPLRTRYHSSGVEVTRTLGGSGSDWTTRIAADLMPDNNARLVITLHSSDETVFVSPQGGRTGTGARIEVVGNWEHGEFAEVLALLAEDLRSLFGTGGKRLESKCEVTYTSARPHSPGPE